MREKIAGITDEAVVNATGSSWGEWIAFLDEQDGTNIDHKERVAALAEEGVESGWWQQQLAVGYEQERGLREVGETADVGYEIGVQRTLQIDRDELWELLISRQGASLWLGDVQSFSTDPGATLETADGTATEIRTVSEGERLRLRWRPPEREEPTTLQLGFEPSPSDDTKTILRIHHEQLADTEERERMRTHWKTVVEQINNELPASRNG